MGKRVKKEAASEGFPEPQATPPVEAFRQLWPELAWHLEATAWGNGKGTREPGGLSLFPQDGLWKVALRERNLGQVTFLSGKTVHEALTRLETALRDHTVSWRPDKYARPQNGSA